MGTTTNIEKKSLEAHVEICAVRYSALETKLVNLEERMDTIEKHIVDIKDSITNKTGGINKQMIAIGTTVVGVMFTAIITLLINLINK